jgi:hypothetical protein
MVLSVTPSTLTTLKNNANKFVFGLLFYTLQYMCEMTLRRFVMNSTQTLRVKLVKIQCRQERMALASDTETWAEAAGSEVRYDHTALDDQVPWPLIVSFFLYFILVYIHKTVVHTWT